MPNKYQREIEEILRNMERTEPRQGLGDRIRAFNRPRPRPRRDFHWALNTSETCILIGIALALLAAGIAYYLQGDLFIPVLRLSLNGIIAVAAFAFILAGLIVAWRERFGYGRRQPTWRGNVVDMTPRRRGPFNSLTTQYRILRLKLRYWRTRGKE